MEGGSGDGDGETVEDDSGDDVETTGDDGAWRRAWRNHLSSTSSLQWGPRQAVHTGSA